MSCHDSNVDSPGWHLVLDQEATSRIWSSSNHPREVLFMTKQTSGSVENCIRRKNKEIILEIVSPKFILNTRKHFLKVPRLNSVSSMQFVQQVHLSTGT